jgi:hypothetical protein
LTAQIVFGEEYSLLGSSPLPYYLVSLRPKYSPQHPVLNTLGTGYLNCLYAYKRKSASPVLNALNTLSLGSSFNVSDQVSHPYKTTGKIVVLYILIFIFLDSKLADKIFSTK